MYVYLATKHTVDLSLFPHALPILKHARETASRQCASVQGTCGSYVLYAVLKCRRYKGDGKTPRNPKPQTSEGNGEKREETQKPERKMGKRRKREEKKSEQILVFVSKI